MCTPSPSAEFDSWASGYDQDTKAETGFPFDGYSILLKTMFEKASCPQSGNVLDLGIGTGNLALPFAQKGCNVWGLDFSTEMLKMAQKKLPGAVLGLADLRADWPPAFDRRYNTIVSAYTFHHFTLDEKINLIKRLLARNLEPGGKLLIGDIAFRNASEEMLLRNSLGADWEQEYYWLADEALEGLSNAGIKASFFKISSCAGIFEINPVTTP